MPSTPSLVRSRTARQRARRAVASAAVVLCPIALAVAPYSGGSPASAATRTTKVVASGDTWVVKHTTTLSSLTVQDGAYVTAPDGFVAVLTVDGVETGGELLTTAGTETVIGAGHWTGDVVVNVEKANDVTWAGLTFPERQAVFVGHDGVAPNQSVTDAVQGGTLTKNAAKGVSITSEGEDFTGFYVKGRGYTIKNSHVTETGNGRSDFSGYGAGLVADGQRVVLANSTIDNTGAARVGILAANGANLLVKNSRIATHDGTLPSDYTPTVDLSQMRSAPWMLGIVGNVRATNITGDNTKATYLSSDISSSGWGVLSTDSGSNAKLSSIDSHVHTTGDEGYGAYAIGGATDTFLGSRVDVGTYGAIVTGGSVVYGDSSDEAVSALNDADGLGLTQGELASVKDKRTVVDSDGWGVMWHGQGSATVTGRTLLRTQRATFLDKGQQVDVSVDGSDGAKLQPADGTLFQLMTNDDPGPVMVNGNLVNEGVYHEPTTAPEKDDSFDVTSAHDTDAVATFTGTHLDGDFWNGFRGGPSTSTGPGPAAATGRNLVLTFDGSTVAGVISSSTTEHAVDTITAADYRQLGVVTNTAGPAVNNGVLVALTGGSTWTVAGTSYLTSLTVGDGSSLVGADGRAVTVTVDGTPTTITPGQTYTGDIVVGLA